MTRRSYLLLAALVFAAVLTVCAFFAFTYNPFAPRFRRVSNFESLAAHKYTYQFLQKRPFDGGLMWISALDGTNSSHVLFDINRRHVIGEVRDVLPHYMNADHSLVLCSKRGPAELRPFARLKAWTSKHLGRVGVSNIRWLSPGSVGRPP